MVLSLNPAESELNKLVANQVPEGTTIDYKLALSVNNDEEKREFLADVASFANTTGGHLIIGMREDKGLPIELLGIAIDDPDATRLRLEEIIRNSIAPRIAGFSIHVVRLQNGNWSIVIYIPQSLSAPHMVTFKGASRFHARNSAGKYQLDVYQIRQAFFISENIAQKIRDFRLDRVSKVGAADTPVNLVDYPKIVLHSIPLAAYQFSPGLAISKIPNQYYQNSQLYKLNSHRFNLDGTLFYSQQVDNKIVEYLQIFRNGIFEYVTADIITPWDSNNPKHLLLTSPHFEQELIKQTDQLLSFQKSLGMEPPIYVFMSFVGVHGIKIRSGMRVTSAYQNAGIDRNVLLIPEVLLESYPFDDYEVAKVLKPAFDAVWNSAGWASSINYGEDGTWKPER